MESKRRVRLLLLLALALLPCPGSAGPLRRNFVAFLDVSLSVSDAALESEFDELASIVRTRIFKNALRGNLERWPTTFRVFPVHGCSERAEPILSIEGTREIDEATLDRKLAEAKRIARGLHSSPNCSGDPSLEKSTCYLQTLDVVDRSFAEAGSDDPRAVFYLGDMLEHCAGIEMDTGQAAFEAAVAQLEGDAIIRMCHGAGDPPRLAGIEVGAKISLRDNKVDLRIPVSRVERVWQSFFEGCGADAQVSPIWKASTGDVGADHGHGGPGRRDAR